MAAHVIRLTMTSVASTLFEVVGSLQCKLNARLSEQQQGYLFQTNVVIPHKTLQQAHARLVIYTLHLHTDHSSIDTASANTLRATFVTLQ